MIIKKVAQGKLSKEEKKTVDRVEKRINQYLEGSSRSSLIVRLEYSLSKNEVRELRKRLADAGWKATISVVYSQEAHGDRGTTIKIR